MIKTSRHIITVSEFSKKEIMNFYKLNDDNVSVVHGCVSRKFKPTFASYPDKYILAVSPLTYYKNFIGIIEAFGKIITKKIKLCIVGGFNKRIFGKKSSAILQKISANTNIKLLENVNDNELIKLYSNAECFIYPSFYEGFGLPPLEAQSCGCPVLVSNIPVFKEVYGDSVLYCDPDDSNDIANKIDMILNDKYLAKSIIQKAFINTQNYSCEKSAIQLVDILKKYI
ncbi:MAG: glycosyltransferase family 4 protein [bacterium]